MVHFSYLRTTLFNKNSWFKVRECTDFFNIHEFRFVHPSRKKKKRRKIASNGNCFANFEAHLYAILFGSVLASIRNTSYDSMQGIHNKKKFECSYFVFVLIDNYVSFVVFCLFENSLDVFYLH